MPEPQRTFDDVMRELHSLRNPANVEGMARFGINSHNTLGIAVTDLRRLARSIGRSQPMADQLWLSGIHEARILASFVADPLLIPSATMAQGTKPARWIAADALRELRAVQNRAWAKSSPASPRRANTPTTSRNTSM